MTRNKKVTRKLALLILAIVLVLLAVFLLPFRGTQPFLASEYRYGPEYHKELDNVPVFSQETGYTCYVVSMAIVKEQLGFPASEDGLRAELNLTERRSGMIPNEWLPCAKQVFEPLSYSVVQENPSSQAEILNIISSQLENGLPAVIFYAAADDWNKPNYNTHYAMVYGIDMRNERIKISNPYGYLEELSFQQLYDGLDFTSYEAEPFVFRLGRKAGVVKPNNIFVFSKSAS